MRKTAIVFAALLWASNVLSGTLPFDNFDIDWYGETATGEAEISLVLPDGNKMDVDYPVDARFQNLKELNQIRDSVWMTCYFDIEYRVQKTRMFRDSREIDRSIDCADRSEKTIIDLDFDQSIFDLNVVNTGNVPEGLQIEWELVNPEKDLVSSGSIGPDFGNIQSSHLVDQYGEGFTARISVPVYAGGDLVDVVSQETYEAQFNMVQGQARTLTIDLSKLTYTEGLPTWKPDTAERELQNRGLYQKPDISLSSSTPIEYTVADIQTKQILFDEADLVPTYNEVVANTLEQLYYLPFDPADMTDEQREFFVNQKWWEIHTIDPYFPYEYEGDMDEIVKDLAKRMSIMKYYIFTERFAQKTMSDRNGDGYTDVAQYVGHGPYIDFGLFGDLPVSDKSVIELSEGKFSKVTNIEALLRTRNSNPSIRLQYGPPAAYVGFRPVIDFETLGPTWGHAEKYGHTMILPWDTLHYGTLFHEWQHILSHSHGFLQDHEWTENFVYLIQRSSSMIYDLSVTLNDAYDRGEIPDVYIDDFKEALVTD